MRTSALRLAVPLCFNLLSPAARAADFPEITDRERNLRDVPEEPGAVAVFIHKKGHFQMLSPDRQEASSRLSVMVRIKVLKEAGREHGEIAIPHSGQVRLSNFKGRTVLPDGRIVPLTEEARFRRKQSERYGRYVTSVAFPAVEPGAILDYSYDLYFDSIYYLEPWYFSEEVPVLYSEIVYQIPREIRTAPWGRDPVQAGLKSEQSRAVTGDRHLKVWAVDLPSVPAEPYGLPFATLATQYMLLPLTYAGDTPLLETWPDVCKDFEERYKEVRRKGGDAAKRALEVSRAASGPRQKATAVFEFVRDRIVTIDDEGVFMARDATVDGVLDRGRGDSIEKALLLQTQLKAVGLDSRLAWVPRRSRGPIEPTVVNPGWFQLALVAVELDGGRVWLDPSDPSLGFGQIDSDLEGMPALLLDRKEPTFVNLPETPFERNGRRAKVTLEVDEEGRVRGSGEMVLAGHHARRRMSPLAADTERADEWRTRLGESYPDFRVDGVKVTESRETSEIRLDWTLTQRDDAVLGDEVTLVPSRPLGPARQPFLVPSDRRRSPIFFPSASREEVELQVRWPAGWKVERAPAPVKRAGSVGEIVTSVQVESAGQSLVYKRRLDVLQKEFFQPAEYEMMRTLFAETERNDAQALVLVRR